jgi:phosphatidylserine/phosphatidylglycerophosphate/cardiolipin synthase-like enzyme
VVDFVADLPVEPKLVRRRPPGVVGSTNLDSRSFGLNDVVNVAMPDPAAARRLEQDFPNDLRQSRQSSDEPHQV